jgi:ribonuclease P protein component
MRRNQRLRRPEQFGRVRRDGKTWSHPLLSLNASRNRVGRTRCGFVVGKQLGKAHDRNRAKRRTREAVRLLYPHVASGWDIVFIVRPAVLQAPFEAILGAVQELLQRAKLWIAADSMQEMIDVTPARAGNH